MSDTPAHSPSSQDARGQTKISDYFSHISKRPAPPSQLVTNSSQEEHLKSNEEGMRNLNNPNTNPMNFETEQGDTVSYSPPMEIDESLNNKTSAAVDVEKPKTIATTPDGNSMNQSKAGNNNKRKKRRSDKTHKPRQIYTRLNVGAALTKQGDTVPPASATETGESVRNLATSLDIRPKSPSKGHIKSEQKPRKGALRMFGRCYEVDEALSDDDDDDEGDAVSHSLGRESDTNEASSGAHLNNRSLVERPDTTAATQGFVAKKPKIDSTRANRRSERQARKHTARMLRRDSEEDYRVWQKRESWYDFGGESDPDNGSDDHKVSPFAQESTNNMNLEFYRNKVRSVPDGDFIENILSEWKDDFKKLERHHGYIQWLFPLKEIGMNNMAQVLKEDEAKAIREDPITKARVLRAYKMMLRFYGLVIKDDALGNVGPSDLFQKRMEHLNSSFHNNLRITRILKALGELGFEHMKKPLLLFLTEEAFVKNTLVNCRRSCVNYWIPTLKSKEEKEFLEKMVKDLEKKEQRQTPKFWN